MGTIKTTDITTKAGILLLDEDHTRWHITELIGWINDAQKAIVVFKANASVKNNTITLAAGTKQSLPTSGIALIDIPRNMVNDNTPGRSIRITMREVLDSMVPDWHSMDQSDQIKHYVYSSLDPKTFYVYPPAINGTKVEMVYSCVPDDVTEASTISVDDIYEPMILDYVLYRAYLKDSEQSADQGRFAVHRDAFIAALTGKTNGEALSNPNATAPASPAP